MDISFYAACIHTLNQVRISVSFSISLEPLNWHPGLHQGGVLQPEERFRGSHRGQEGGLTSPGAADSHDQGGYSIMGSSLGLILSPGGEVKCSKKETFNLAWTWTLAWAWIRYYSITSSHHIRILVHNCHNHVLGQKSIIKIHNAPVYELQY